MITLKYLEPADFSQLIEWSGDEAFLLQWAGPSFQYPLSIDQLKHYLSGANECNSQKYIYKAVEASTRKVIGYISLEGIDRYHRSCLIGKVLIGNGFRGNGYGKQMVKDVLRIGFEELKLHRISLYVFDFNMSAIKCYERSGLVKEGLSRDARRYKDTYWNIIQMSILEDEWKRNNTK